MRRKKIEQELIKALADPTSVASLDWRRAPLAVRREITSATLESILDALAEAVEDAKRPSGSAGD